LVKLTARQPRPQQLAHTATDCRCNHFRCASAVEKCKGSAGNAHGRSNLEVGIPRLLRFDFRKLGYDVTRRILYAQGFSELLQLDNSLNINPWRSNLAHGCSCVVGASDGRTDAIKRQADRY
jgi:hypothetical protein